MKVAKKAGAQNLLLTAEPDSSAARLAGVHAASSRRRPWPAIRAPKATSVLPMGSAYEGALFVLFEVMVLKLKSAARRVARGDARAPHQHGIGQAMRYELMLPHQIRTAIAENWPVVLPLGVLEYHGEHMAVGMDTLAVIKMLDLIEAEMQLGHPAALLLRRGELCGRAAGGQRLGAGRRRHARRPFAEALFFSLLRIGFRNIHAIIHHQTENFAAGMPTDLAFKSAGRQAIFRFIERESGEGWWGNEKMATYYAEHAAGNNPFNWVRVHPLMSPEILAQYPFDHAGQGETSLMMALCPEAVDMDALRREQGLVHGVGQGCVGRAWRQGPGSDPAFCASC